MVCVVKRHTHGGESERKRGIPSTAERTSTDKATFKIVFDDNYINNETFKISTDGSKKLFDVTIKFKALDNLTIISYEKKTY